MTVAGIRRNRRDGVALALVSLVAFMLVSCGSQCAAVDSPTNAASNHLLLTDHFGNAVRVPTNAVNPNLHPPAATGLQQQIPTTPKGMPVPEEIRERLAEKASTNGAIQWFPGTPPVLMPYPGSLDEFGNTAIQPGPVFDTDPIGRGAQAVKYQLSDAGLRYLLDQSVAMASMTGTASGASALQYYFVNFVGKWALLETGGAASWLSTEFNVQLGLSPSSRSESPQRNLATLVSPNNNVFGPNGIWMSELAWQQSLADGKVVVVAGLVDQAGYLDANNFANNSHGQLLNSALVNSMVLPLPNNNLGVNIQWQPNDSWYLILGSGANNQLPGNSPFDSLSLDNWSWLLEFGLTAKDVFGLGPGNYRLQPFVATVGGETQAGLGVNIGQHLGKTSPLAYYGRFGVGGSHVTLNGATAQIATGLAAQNPLQYTGLSPKVRNDYLATGFIWSQPSQALQPAVHTDEYGVEMTYVLQLTPFASLQPDLQVIWNPVNNPVADHNFIFQLQLNLNW
jgi:hypothetical protein